MVVVGREVPLGGKGWGGKNRHRRETAGAPVSGQADASVATEALEGPRSLSSPVRRFVFGFSERRAPSCRQAC